MERKDIVITKDGVDTTIVNYIYKINNINATHTLVVSVSSGSLPTFIKYGNSWRSDTILQKDSGVWGSIEYTKLYVKQNGTWVEGANTSSSTTAIVFGGEFNNGE